MERRRPAFPARARGCGIGCLCSVPRDPVLLKGGDRKRSSVWHLLSFPRSHERRAPARWCRQAAFALWHRQNAPARWCRQDALVWLVDRRSERRRVTSTPVRRGPPIREPATTAAGPAPIGAPRRCRAVSGAAPQAEHPAKRAAATTQRSGGGPVQKARRQAGVSRPTAPARRKRTSASVE